MITQDFSKWGESLFNYGKTLVSYKGILEFDGNDDVSFAADYKQKQAELLNNIIEAHLYWIGFGVGLENLIKATLIKHKVLSITRRNDFDNKLPVMETQFADYTELQSYRQSSILDRYQKVYQHVNEVTLTADNNPWLGQQFLNVGINHPLEINTPTLLKLSSKEIPKLEIIGKITFQESDDIFKALEVFRLMRRNVDSHIYLQSRTIGSIDRDIDDVYIPLINLLTNIYNRS